MFQSSVETFPRYPEVSRAREKSTMGPEFVIAFMVAAAAAIIICSLALRYKMRELRHKERMTALEKGSDIASLNLNEKEPAPWSPRVYLLRGLIWLFTGIGLSVFLLGLSLTIGSQTETLEDKLWRAQNLRRQGATEDEIKQYLNDHSKQTERKMPEGLSLIGLIPIGVGLAYLIYYRKEQNAGEAITPARA
jgi:hypothetical protein